MRYVTTLSYRKIIRVDPILMIILILEFVKIDQLCLMTQENSVLSALNELLKDVIPAKEAVECKTCHTNMLENSSDVRSHS